MTISDGVQVEFGSSISNAVQSRVVQLLSMVGKNNNNNKQLLSHYFINKNITLHLSFGNTKTTQSIIPSSELTKLGPEGFIVRSSNTNNNTLIVATDGNKDKGAGKVNIGAHFGAYALLERVLGFAFFHPLRPIIPSQFHIRSGVTNTTPSVDIKEKPYWAIRGMHYHTEHPLELTELVNGFDSQNEKWESMIPEYERLLEWLIANGQNRLEWVLLYAKDWADFAWSPLRAQRLFNLTTVAHQWGILVGADCGIGQTQQHAWPLVQNVTNIADETRQIHRHLDWLLDLSGFDFLSTESGFSEFTHPSCTTMLEWMNITVDYTESKYGKQSFIKCHCSQGQTCPEFKDPMNGNPINFNFLPYYADSRLGVYPHTVQYYNWTEPAPTYGNVNFQYMFDFLKLEAGKRPVVYHGETAYWVNYDIDVPLFLPIYANGRLSDLRAIATAQENKSIPKIDGQINFCSGWEWGYWLNDMITSRAAWNPQMQMTNQRDALHAILMPIVSHLSAETVTQQALAAILLDMIELEQQFMIYGRVNATSPAPPTVIQRNGQAYLQGWDTWSEVMALASRDISTQPIKVTFLESMEPFRTPDYEKDIRPLLRSIEVGFVSIADRLDALSGSILSDTFELYADIRDSARITALRAIQVHRLYNYASSWWSHFGTKWRQEQLDLAKHALINATIIVSQRESNYRVPLERIAGWRSNPTSYHFGYLWTVHSLYYFWRDYGQAVQIDVDAIISPCFLNIIRPIDVAFGEGIWLNATAEAYNVLEQLGILDFFVDCLSSPENEPHYPENLKHK